LRLGKDFPLLRCFLSCSATTGSRELITASTPIIVTEDGNEAAVAVVGAQLRYSKFHELFMNTTKQCFSSSNEVLCHDVCRSDVSIYTAPLFQGEADLGMFSMSGRTGKTKRGRPQATERRTAARHFQGPNLQNFVKCTYENVMRELRIVS